MPVIHKIKKTISKTTIKVAAPIKISFIEKLSGAYPNIAEKQLNIHEKQYPKNSKKPIFYTTNNYYYYKIILKGFFNVKQAEGKRAEKNLLLGD